VDDPQRKPGKGDRVKLAARIMRAADQGRIAPADRDIRLENVASAESMGDLDLMARDLDQLEAALPEAGAVAPATAPTTTPAATPAATPSAGPSPAPLADKVTEQAIGAAKTTVRSIGVVTILILVLLAGGAGALTYFDSNGSDEAKPGELFEPEPIPTGATEAPPGDEPVDEPSQASGRYALTADGVRAFIEEYRAKFGTTLVVSLTMYPDYAVVQVPQEGKRRHAGFLYRRDDGWQDFGGVSANFPGSDTVDLQSLDVPALMHNIGKARRTLNVEEISTTYVNIDYRPQSDEAPNVNIYVSNEYSESGYLATRLDGTVERAYPFGQ
jgi:hypothetical protein